MITANNTSATRNSETSSIADKRLRTQIATEGNIANTQDALIRITNKVRRSLDFSVICETVTQEMLSLLNADRVAIYQFNSDWSGRFVFESAGSEWISLVEAQQSNELIAKNVNACSVRSLDTGATADTHLQMTYGGSFVQGEIFRVCEDIEDAGFSDCYVEVLKSYQARAYAIIAIYVDNQLWGLLAAYQNTGPRQWKETEVQLLSQVAEQLGIALKQAEYVKTIQAQNHEISEALQQLSESQAQLVQTERMASLGKFVAGIAHEVNNPINFIHANLPHVESYVNDLLTLVRRNSERADSAIDSTATSRDNDEIDLEFILEDLPKILVSMSSGSARIRDIVQALRNFSRLDESGIKQIDLHEGIDSTLVVLNHQLAASSHHPKIEVIKNYGDIPTVECDPAQINQVLLNVLTNAIESIKEICRVSYPESRCSNLQPRIWISTEVNEQNHVSVCIRDNGLGIAESHQPKVFDHFFTTKSVGQGTGLGLAIAYQIVVEAHGGQLTVESTLGEGATFYICLPV